MKSRKMTLLTIATLFAILNFPLRLAGQDIQASLRQPSQAHHYKLIDLGTLGGAQSTVAGLEGQLSITRELVGCADTSAADPDYPNFNPFLSPFGADPFICSHV